jgi:hypothetical protein
MTGVVVLAGIGTEEFEVKVTVTGAVVDVPFSASTPALRFTSIANPDADLSDESSSSV